MRFVDPKRKTAIEELVGLSCRALDKTLKERSKRLIEEKGWRQAEESLDCWERRRPSRTRESPQRETIIIDPPRGRRISELEA